MPLVSIIIPTFNRASLLPRAINSVLGQTFRDWELIVVDDGSGDGTDLPPRAAADEPKISLVRLPQNRGVSHARNTGVRRSSGRFIAFLDSDDEWLPPKLERQIAWMGTHPDYRICQTREYWIRHGKRVNPPVTHEKVGGSIFEQSLARCMITPSSVIMLRDLFDESGGFDESLPACEDYDLWLRITCRYPVGLIDEYLLRRYGGHADQLSSTVPVLDSYRIKSIITLLDSGILSAEQTAIARKSLAEKANIVAQGCLKRGRKEDYEYYRNIARRFA
jgi:glycosyltransferase involved in cell wall biosynthesis